MGAPPIEKVSFRSPWKTITTINPNSDGSVAQSLEAIYGQREKNSVLEIRMD